MAAVGVTPGGIMLEACLRHDGRGRCPRPPELAVPRAASYFGGGSTLLGAIGGSIGVRRSSGLVTSRSTLLATWA